MVLLSYFLHKIPKDSFPLSLWWGWGACRGEGWLRKHDWVWGNVRGQPVDLCHQPRLSGQQWPSASLSHLMPVARVSVITTWPFPWESFLPPHICGSLLYSGLERGEFGPLFMLRSRLVIAASEAFCTAQSCLDNKTLRWGHKSSHHFKSPCNDFKYWKYYLKECLCAVVAQEWNNSTFYLRPWKYFPLSNKIDTSFPPLALRVGKMLRSS